MTHTYEELKKKTIAELRRSPRRSTRGRAGLHAAEQGTPVPAVCKALGIDTHAHHAAALAEKAAVKAKMREINAKKATAVESGDHELLRQLRRQYHRLNHTLRTAAKHSPES